MELSAMNDISNQNKNLIQQTPNGEKKIDIANQYFVKNNTQSPKKSSYVIRFWHNKFVIYMLSFIIMMGYIAFIIQFSQLDLYLKIIIILCGALIPITFLTLSYNRVVFTKDDTNKKILIKAVNHFCIPIFKLNLDIENAHFYVRTSNNNENVPDETLIIINDYKNLVGIDLDESDIKQKPAKFLYSFWNISTWKYGGGTSDHINNFIGTSSDDNPLFFNIDKYLKKIPISLQKKGSI